MLTDDELTELFEDLESDRVERKRTESDGKKIRDAICAFANDMTGGYESASVHAARSPTSKRNKSWSNGGAARIFHGTCSR